jgi:hypothetical protein
LTNDRIEADYVWHDLAKDELNQQTCIFERFTPTGAPDPVADKIGSAGRRPTRAI